MTPDEFEIALATLNWKKIDFARAVQVDPATVSRWMAGQEIPPWVGAHLGLLIDVQKIHNRYITPPKKPKKPVA